MKKVLIYVPVVLSLVILGAHFLRYGNSIGVIGSLALIALLIVRRPWVAQLMQGVLLGVFAVREFCVSHCDWLLRTFYFGPSLWVIVST